MPRSGSTTSWPILDYAATQGTRVGGYRTLLGVPIQQDGMVSGVLALTRNEVRGFSAADRALAVGFAEQAAISVANVRLLETIERQRSQLARFLSPQVADLVSSPEGEAMLAGHRREITAMFCDLRNFTTFSETAEPEEVLGFLRRYHATVGGLVVEHEGTLEHFAGDGIMVFFNDPVTSGRPRSPGGTDGRRHPGAVRRDQRGVAAARPCPPGRDRDRDRLRDDGPDRLRGPL